MPQTPAKNNDNFFSLRLDSTNSSLLPRSNKPKAKKRDFASWMCAWKIFMQNVLFYRPEMHSQLFSYLQIFCNFVRMKFKFANCYAYDKAQRTQLPAQISAPHNNHTTSWSQQNYLISIYVTIPACYYCNSYGRFAHTCPFK